MITQSVLWWLAGPCLCLLTWLTKELPPRDWSVQHLRVCLLTWSCVEYYLQPLFSLQTLLKPLIHLVRVILVKRGNSHTEEAFLKPLRTVGCPMKLKAGADSGGSSCQGRQLSCRLLYCPWASLTAWPRGWMKEPVSFCKWNVRDVEFFSF